MTKIDLNSDEKVEWYEALPFLIDRFRVFPRIFISIYIYLLYDTVQWFMALPDPNSQQAALISVIVGTGTAWFGLYVNTKNIEE